MHNRSVNALRAIAGLVWDALQFVALGLRPRATIQAENLFLRRQLALFKERGLRPHRADPATKLSLALLSGLFDWRSARQIVAEAPFDGEKRRFLHAYL